MFRSVASSFFEFPIERLVSLFILPEKQSILSLHFIHISTLWRTEHSISNSFVSHSISTDAVNLLAFVDLQDAWVDVMEWTVALKKIHFRRITRCRQSAWMLCPFFLFCSFLLHAINSHLETRSWSTFAAQQLAIVTMIFNISLVMEWAVPQKRFV